MSPEMLLALMATWTCHTMTVDVPERRETVAKTVCVQVAAAESKPAATSKKPVTKKVTYTKRKKNRSRRRKYS